MTPNEHKQAARWEATRNAIYSLLARMDKDLEKYEQQENANKVAIGIKKQSVEIIEDFIEETEQLLLMQGNLVKSYSSLNAKHNELLSEYKTLKRYAQSKGCDLDLLKYMRQNDY